jgi:membrane protein implicated in regulation of membrane protease activity
MEKIPFRVVVRYTLLALPGVAAVVAVIVVARSWLELPPWMLWAVPAGWILKEIVTFPFVWRSYDPERKGVSAAMTGSCGVVLKRLSPKGRVRVRGESWRAERLGPGDAIEPGRAVRVVRREGLTLFVEPEDDCNPPPPAA